MKIKTLIFIGTFLMVSITNASTSKQNTTSNDILINYNHQKQIALALAPAKSNLDLELLAQKESPLDLLSHRAKQRFIDSVVFTDEGNIGGYYYADLEAELTPTQIHSILSLIGAQHTLVKLKNARIETNTDMLLMLTPTPSYSQQSLGSVISIGGSDDHKEYYCASPKTCREEAGSICMSGC